VFSQFVQRHDFWNSAEFLQLTGRLFPVSCTNRGECDAVDSPVVDPGGHFHADHAKPGDGETQCPVAGMFKSHVFSIRLRQNHIPERRRLVCQAHHDRVAANNLSVAQD
jgi:hypothetical protein